MTPLAIVQAAADYGKPIFEALSPLAIPGAIWLATALVGELKKRGYKTTYAAAIVRAAGAGAVAARDRGLPVFGTTGMAYAAKVGAGYLMSTVAPEGAALGISTLEDHAVRVAAQLKAIQLQAMADAAAALPLAPIVSARDAGADLKLAMGIGIPKIDPLPSSS